MGNDCRQWLQSWVTVAIVGNGRSRGQWSRSWLQLWAIVAGVYEQEIGGACSTWWAPLASVLHVSRPFVSELTTTTFLLRNLYEPPTLPKKWRCIVMQFPRTICEILDPSARLYTLAASCRTSWPCVPVHSSICTAFVTPRAMEKPSKSLLHDRSYLPIKG